VQRGHRFIPARSLSTGEHGREKQRYRARLELSLVISLVLVLCFFLIWRRAIHIREFPAYSSGGILLDTDLPPATKKGGSPLPPSMPQIPIPSEDEFISNEVTIDFTDLDMINDLSAIKGEGGDDDAYGSRRGGPRPLYEVIPEYPDDLRDKGISGVVVLSIRVTSSGKVDSVIVLENTSGSARLGKAAVRAAYLCRYAPYTENLHESGLWIRRPYRFEGN